jgi:hypothetical protein
MKTQTIRELLAEVTSRVDSLEKRREALMQELDAINGELGHNGVKLTRTYTQHEKVHGNKYGKKQAVLLDVLRPIMRKAPGEMSVAELGMAVLETGYQTRSKAFSTVVSQVLTKNPEYFHRVARGVYAATEKT